MFKDVIDYFDDGDVLIFKQYQKFSLLVCTGNKEKRELESRFSVERIEC